MQGRFHPNRKNTRKRLFPTNFRSLPLPLLLLLLVVVVVAVAVAVAVVDAFTFVFILFGSTFPKTSLQELEARVVNLERRPDRRGKIWVLWVEIMGT